MARESFTQTYPGVRVALAAVHRVDHGAGTPLTWDQCLEAVAHPTDGAKREYLVQAIAYLAAQVVGYQHAADLNARLAIETIRGALRNYDERAERSDPT